MLLKVFLSGGEGRKIKPINGGLAPTWKTELKTAKLVFPFESVVPTRARLLNPPKLFIKCARLFFSN
jgi:hypothetical protein